MSHLNDVSLYLDPVWVKRVSRPIQYLDGSSLSPVEEMPAVIQYLFWYMVDLHLSFFGVYGHPSWTPSIKMRLKDASSGTISVRIPGERLGRGGMTTQYLIFKPTSKGLICVTGTDCDPEKWAALLPTPHKAPLFFLMDKTVGMRLEHGKLVEIGLPKLHLKGVLLLSRELWDHPTISQALELAYSLGSK